MATEFKEEQLLGSWVHSHEEDKGDEVVFRSASFPFPPSRGRTGFTIKAGGELDLNQPGRDERPSRNTGNWTLDGNILTITSPNWSKTYEVKKVGDGTLVLQPR